MDFNKLTPQCDDSVRTEVTQRKQREYHLVGSERKIDGHILFSYNTETGEVKQAQITLCHDIDFMTLRPLHSPKVVVEPNCVYRQALNKKNFIKRLKREGII